MSNASRRFRSVRVDDRRPEPVLPALHERVVNVGVNEPGVAESLAREVHLPIAAVRGAISSFADARHRRGAVRVCEGTSCLLSGGDRLRRVLEAERPCEGVYCLGYCDRAPAMLTASGSVVHSLTPDAVASLGLEEAGTEPRPASVRCESPHAVVTARLIDDRGAPASPEYDGLRRALRLTPDSVVDVVIKSGLKGRGGAAFPTGRKWQLCAAATGVPKYVVANGDEGDPGSFIDRELMERDPHGILEGMAICAHAVGASEGYVFIRSEYPRAVDRMQEAIDAATDAGAIGPDALGIGRPFRVRVVRGMGSYVCGEETALLNAIEGGRGEVRPRPPFPVDAGLFGLPTVVDNVETLVNVPWIMRHGSEAYAAMGTADSRGTKAICLNRGFAHPGIVEVEFGRSLRDVIERSGGGGAEGRELEAVLLGGPMGSILTPDKWDVPVCVNAMSRRRINLGHAGLVAIPRGTDWGLLLRHMLAFMKDESCGKCVPCRLGTARAHRLAEHGFANGSQEELRVILGLMREASLCAFGRETPGPIATILEQFGDRLATGVNA